MSINVRGSGGGMNVRGPAGGGFRVGPPPVSPPSPPLSGPLMHLDASDPASWPGSGTTWYDLVPANGADDATLINGVTWSSDAGGAFTFSAASFQRASVTSLVVPQAAYTKAVWFKLADTTSDNNLVSSDTGGHFMYFSATSTMYCGHSDWGYYNAYPSTTTFSAGVWYLAVLTFNTDDGMTLYVDGVLDSTYTANKNPHPGDGTTYIGSYGGGNFLNGEVGEVFTWDRALSSVEVAMLYADTAPRYLSGNPNVVSVKLTAAADGGAGFPGCDSSVNVTGGVATDTFMYWDPTVSLPTFPSGTIFLSIRPVWPTVVEVVTADPGATLAFTPTNIGTSYITTGSKTATVWLESGFDGSGAGELNFTVTSGAATKTYKNFLVMQGSGGSYSDGPWPYSPEIVINGVHSPVPDGGSVSWSTGDAVSLAGFIPGYYVRVDPGGNNVTSYGDFDTVFNTPTGPASFVVRVIGLGSNYNTVFKTFTANVDGGSGPSASTAVNVVVKLIDNVTFDVVSTLYPSLGDTVPLLTTQTAMIDIATSHPAQKVTFSKDPSSTVTGEGYGWNQNNGHMNAYVYASNPGTFVSNISVTAQDSTITTYQLTLSFS